MTVGPVPPRVSVIIPCYNAEDFVAETIASVVRQDLVDWECIVVDDGSTDGSYAVACEAARGDQRLAVTTQPNSGVHVARQEGFRRSDERSGYLVFLDADDVLEPNFLTVLATHLDAHPEVGLVYGACITVDAEGRPVDDVPTVPARYVPSGVRVREIPLGQPETPLPALISRHEAIPSTSMLRRSVFARTRGWRPFGIEDKDMVIQMALLAPVHFLPLHLTRYRRHHTNRSLHNFYESMQELHRAWWSDGSLAAGELRRVRGSIAFDRRISAMTSWRAARAAVRRGEVRDALGEAARSAKRCGGWLVASSTSRFPLRSEQPGATGGSTA